MSHMTFDNWQVLATYGDGQPRTWDLRGVGTAINNGEGQPWLAIPDSYDAAVSSFPTAVEAQAYLYRTAGHHVA